jgi:hypothetical protein
MKLLVYKLETIWLSHAGVISPLNCTTPGLGTTSVPRVGARERAPCACVGCLSYSQESATCIQDPDARWFWPRALTACASSKPVPAQTLDLHTRETGICTGNLPLAHHCNERYLGSRMFGNHRRQGYLSLRPVPDQGSRLTRCPQ